MAAQTHTETKHTPRHTPDFIGRLTTLLSAIGIPHRQYVGVIMQATGLSKSGARLVIESKRPPKQLVSFTQLVEFFIRALKGKDIIADYSQIYNYLLFDAENPLVKESDAISLSDFMEHDPILTSEIIVLIKATAKKYFETTDFPDDKMRLIQFRILSYAFKNKEPSDSPQIKAHAKSLLSLANDNML
jgi:hypothetical protein